MRISYQWTMQEWREALALATARSSSRGTPLPGHIWPLIAIPAFGALYELKSALGASRISPVRGSLLPLVMLLMAVATTLMLVSRFRRRTTKVKQTMPAGEWEAAIGEAGWQIAEIGPSSTRGARGPSRSRGDVGNSGPSPGTSQQSSSERAVLHPWSELVEARRNGGAIVLVRRDGFDALPARKLTPEQHGLIHRLVNRKLRPQPQRVA